MRSCSSLLARRAPFAALVLVLALVAAAASGGGSPPASAHAAGRPPVSRVVDPADARGRLDLRGALLRQGLQRLSFTITTGRRVALEGLSRARRRQLCLDLLPAAGGAVRLCLTHRRTALLREPLHGPGRARLVAARVGRPGWRSLSVSVSLAAAGLSPGRVRWSAVSMWRAPGRCRRTCHDRAPNRGLVRWDVRSTVVAGCTAAGPSLRLQGPSNRRAIALTFDDGPSGYTERVLAELVAHHAHGTFFEVGDQIAGRESSLRHILAAGSVIGDHSWNHALLNATTGREQIARTNRTIRRASGFSTCLFRAPYGAASRGLIDAARRLGALTIGWDVDPRDWSLPGSAAIVRNVLEHAHPGAIVIMHDGGGPRDETVAALHSVIPRLQARGYRLVTVPQLLGLRLRYAYR